MDDILFGATIDLHAYNFSSKMKKAFEMSMIGELTYLLGNFRNLMKVFLFLS